MKQKCVHWVRWGMWKSAPEEGGEAGSDCTPSLPQNSPGRWALEKPSVLTPTKNEA